MASSTRSTPELIDAVFPKLIRGAILYSIRNPEKIKAHSRFIEQAALSTLLPQDDLDLAQLLEKTVDFNEAIASQKGKEKLEGETFNTGDFISLLAYKINDLDFKQARSQNVAIYQAIQETAKKPLENITPINTANWLKTYTDRVFSILEATLDDEEIKQAMNNSQHSYDDLIIPMIDLFYIITLSKTQNDSFLQPGAIQDAMAQDERTSDPLLNTLMNLAEGASSQRNSMAHRDSNLSGHSSKQALQTRSPEEIGESRLKGKLVTTPFNRPDSMPTLYQSNTHSRDGKRNLTHNKRVMAEGISLFCFQPCTLTENITLEKMAQDAMWQFANSEANIERTVWGTADSSKAQLEAITKQLSAAATTFDSNKNLQVLIQTTISQLWTIKEWKTLLGKTDSEQLDLPLVKGAIARLLKAITSHKDTPAIIQVLQPTIVEALYSYFENINDHKNLKDINPEQLTEAIIKAISLPVIQESAPDDGAVESKEADVVMNSGAALATAAKIFLDLVIKNDGATVEQWHKASAALHMEGNEPQLLLRAPIIEEKFPSDDELLHQQAKAHIALQLASTSQISNEDFKSQASKIVAEQQHLEAIVQVLIANKNQLKENDDLRNYGDNNAKQFLYALVKNGGQAGEPLAVLQRLRDKPEYHQEIFKIINENWEKLDTHNIPETDGGLMLYIPQALSILKISSNYGDDNLPNLTIDDISNLNQATTTLFNDPSKAKEVVKKYENIMQKIIVAASTFREKLRLSQDDDKSVTTELEQIIKRFKDNIKQYRGNITSFINEKILPELRQKYLLDQPWTDAKVKTYEALRQSLHTALVAVATNNDNEDNKDQPIRFPPLDIHAVTQQLQAQTEAISKEKNEAGSNIEQLLINECNTHNATKDYTTLAGSFARWQVLAHNNEAQAKKIAQEKGVTLHPPFIIAEGFPTLVTTSPNLLDFPKGNDKEEINAWAIEKIAGFQKLFESFLENEDYKTFVRTKALKENLSFKQAHNAICDNYLDEILRPLNFMGNMPEKFKMAWETEKSFNDFNEEYSLDITKGTHKSQQNYQAIAALYIYPDYFTKEVCTKLGIDQNVIEAISKMTPSEAFEHLNNYLNNSQLPQPLEENAEGTTDLALHQKIAWQKANNPEKFYAAYNGKRGSEFSRFYYRAGLKALDSNIDKDVSRLMDAGGGVGPYIFPPNLTLEPTKTLVENLRAGKPFGPSCIKAAINIIENSFDFILDLYSQEQLTSILLSKRGDQHPIAFIGSILVSLFPLYIGDPKVRTLEEQILNDTIQHTVEAFNSAYICDPTNNSANLKELKAKLIGQLNQLAQHINGAALEDETKAMADVMYGNAKTQLVEGRKSPEKYLFENVFIIKVLARANTENHDIRYGNKILQNYLPYLKNFTPSMVYSALTYNNVNVDELFNTPEPILITETIGDEDAALPRAKNNKTAVQIETLYGNSGLLNLNENMDYYSARIYLEYVLAPKLNALQKQSATNLEIQINRLLEEGSAEKPEIFIKQAKNIIHSAYSSKLLGDKPSYLHQREAHFGLTTRTSTPTIQAKKSELSGTDYETSLNNLVENATLDEAYEANDPRNVINHIISNYFLGLEEKPNYEQTLQIINDIGTKLANKFISADMYKAAHEKTIKYYQKPQNLIALDDANYKSENHYIKHDYLDFRILSKHINPDVALKIPNAGTPNSRDNFVTKDNGFKNINAELTANANYFLPILNKLLNHSHFDNYGENEKIKFIKHYFETLKVSPQLIKDFKCNFMLDILCSYFCANVSNIKDLENINGNKVSQSVLNSADAREIEQHFDLYWLTDKDNKPASSVIEKLKKDIASSLTISPEEIEALSAPEQPEDINKKLLVKFWKECITPAIAKDLIGKNPYNITEYLLAYFQHYASNFSSVENTKFEKIFFSIAKTVSQYKKITEKHAELFYDLYESQTLTAESRHYDGAQIAIKLAEITPGRMLVPEKIFANIVATAISKVIEKGEELSEENVRKAQPIDKFIIPENASENEYFVELYSQISASFEVYENRPPLDKQENKRQTLTNLSAALFNQCRVEKLATKAPAVDATSSIDGNPSTTSTAEMNLDGQAATPILPKSSEIHSHQKTVTAMQRSLARDGWAGACLQEYMGTLVEPEGTAHPSADDFSQAAEKLATHIKTTCIRFGTGMFSSTSNPALAEGMKYIVQALENKALKPEQIITLTQAFSAARLDVVPGCFSGRRAPETTKVYQTLKAIKTKEEFIAEANKLAPETPTNRTESSASNERPQT